MDGDGDKKTGKCPGRLAHRSQEKRSCGSIGDIGTHACRLAGFVTGLKLQSLSADLATFGAGRALDDNAHVMMRYEDGAGGLLWSSQVALGNLRGTGCSLSMIAASSRYGYVC